MTHDGPRCGHRPAPSPPLAFGRGPRCGRFDKSAPLSLPPWSISHRLSVGLSAAGRRSKGRWRQIPPSTVRVNTDHQDGSSRCREEACDASPEDVGFQRSVRLTYWHVTLVKGRASLFTHSHSHTLRISPHIPRLFLYYFSVIH